MARKVTTTKPRKRTTKKATVKKAKSKEPKQRAPRLRKSKKQRMAEAIPTQLTKTPTAVRLKDIKYDPKIFLPMHTNTIVDKWFSNKGGIPRACNFIVVGDPGVGKTTVALDIVCDVQRHNPKLKVLFISGEMNQIDMYEYMERYPKFGEIDILFLADYVEENTKLVIEEMLSTGYDLVLGDSFVEIQDAVKESSFMTTTAAEKWLIDLMCSHNQGNNKRKSYTTFLMIQQMTKGGNFTGSNKLKHNTTGMLFIKFNDNNSQRYIEFDKNRRGNVNKKLYFTLSKPDNVDYNENKYEEDLKTEAKLKHEIENLEEEAKAFDELLKLTNTSETVIENEVNIEDSNEIDVN